MDMLNILKNFDAAEKGEKPAVGLENKNSMKAILESFNKVDECGMMPMGAAQMPEKQGNPVTMSVSLNASGKENVDELMALLKSAGIGNSGPATEPNEPKDMNALRAIVMDPEMSDTEDDMDEDERFQASTSPDEEYADHSTITKDLSGGINGQKKHFKAAQRGDNAMAVESVKERLWAALNEKKTTEGKYKNDAQRKAIHANKMKKK